ncbi:MAG: mono/diheme cytochrome c family protein [Verrucomicrobiales bacterium]|jgi:mono/diheme cytochrome c family protein
MQSMKALGRKLCLALASLVIVCLVGCSVKDRLPDLPKIPKIGKKEPALPAHVGPAGSGSYLFYKSCANCHGDPPSKIFAGLMKDLPTIIDPRRVKTLDQNWLLKIISEGGAGVGKRASMPAFKDVLTDSEIRRIVSYLNGNPV